MNDTYIHLAVAADDKYIPHAAVTILSACLHTSRPYSMHIHFLSNGVAPSSLEKLRRMVAEHKQTLSIYQVSNIERLAGIKLSGTIALSSYIRLFLSSLLPQDVKRLIYLDSDVITSDNLANLWDVDLEGNLLGAVMDVSQGECNTRVGLPPHNRYINAGVLLIPLERWRDENIEARFIRFLHLHHGKVFHHDQGVINAVLVNAIKILPPRFNLMTFMYEFSAREIGRLYGTRNFYTEEELVKARQHPCCIHFTESLSNRPWVMHCTHPERHRYQKIRALTPWGEWLLEKDRRTLPAKFLSVCHRVGGAHLFDLARVVLGKLSSLLKKC